MNSDPVFLISRSIVDLDSDFLWGVVRNNGGPAERAVGVGTQPSVDTGHMENVAAFGKPPEGIAVLKIAQANRALCFPDQTFFFLVVQNGDRTDHRRREPDGPDVPDWVIEHRVKILRSPVGTSPSPPGAVPDDDHVVAEEEEETG
ncbi:unnamed protein product [Cuscuta epithymum]|uniref:Uncharacterized protein n=1 Tax=Cuscuta epithymum TaxID=186058 RepID=A0AAV0EZM3_9ASTE|nr:unnamed protein product [Cuscuta epithymum]